MVGRESGIPPRDGGDHPPEMGGIIPIGEYDPPRDGDWYEASITSIESSVTSVTSMEGNVTSIEASITRLVHCPSATSLGCGAALCQAAQPIQASVFRPVSDESGLRGRQGPPSVRRAACLMPRGRQGRPEKVREGMRGQRLLR